MILVTGAAGKSGQAVVRALAAAGAPTRAFVHRQEQASLMQDCGAGEVVVNAIDCDGCMKGYDLRLASELRSVMHLPMTVLGGAGSLEDIAQLIRTCGVVGASAGSLFVFKGIYRAVLISYPNLAKKDELIRSALGLNEPNH